MNLMMAWIEMNFAQLAGAVDSIDCISAEG